MAGFKAIHKKNAEFFQLKSSDPFHAWISFSCKPNHWGGTQLGKANERETAERPKRNFERKQRGAKCFKMADVRSQWRMDLGVDAYGDVKSCGQGSGQSERGRWNVIDVSNGDTGAAKKKKKKNFWLVDFCSSKLLFGKCWLLTWGISLLAKDQKAIHGDKKSLIKGSGRLWPRLQQTGFVGIVCVQPNLQSYFWTLQTLQSIALYTLSL